MKKIVLATIISLLSSVSFASDVVRKVSGNCQDLKESYPIKKSEEGFHFFEFDFKGFGIQGGIFCKGKIVTSVSITAAPSNAYQAAELFKLIESDLVSTYGEVDDQLTQEHAEYFYLSEMLGSRTGFVGVHVSQRWGKKVNNLQLLMNKIGSKWIIHVSYGD